MVFSNGFLTDESADGSFYNLEMKNVGVGPALIKRVAIGSGQTSFTDFGQYTEWLSRTTPTAFTVPDTMQKHYFDYSDILPESALPANEEVRLITVKGNPMARLFVKNLQNFYLQVDYESLYGEKWTAYYPV